MTNVLELLAGSTREKILTDDPFLDHEDMEAVLQFAAQANGQPT